LRQFRRATKLVAVALAVATAAACGGGASDNGSGPAADGELDLDATLTYPMVNWDQQMDPDASQAGYPVTMLFPFYDRLVHIDPATAEFEPGLAESWEFLEDNTVLRLNLREGVKFHDGEDFTAEVVEANFERSRTNEAGRDESRTAVQAVESVEIVDDLTIDLIKNPEDEIGWAILIPQLSVNLGIMISPAALENPDLDRNPVGAGPWKFVEFASDRVVGERFEDYWDPDSVLVQRLELILPSSSEGNVNALVSGAYDLAQLEPTQLEEAQGISDLDVEVVPTLRTWHAYFNHSLPPFDDENVRRAFLQGLDRQAIADAITGGIGIPTPQYFPPDYYAFSADYGMDRYPYDPEAARELVESSKYYEGEPIEVIMEVENQPAARVRLAELIQDQMAKVGIITSFTPKEGSAIGAYLEGEAHVDLSPRSRLDPLQHLAASIDEDGESNPGGFTTEEIQSLLEKAADLPPGDERTAIVQELSALQTDGAWSGISLFSESEVYASRCVTGFVPPVATHFTFTNVGILAGCS
jgi:peptide/nickel transport system substrate-binding protein